jgi:YHS domain-containing protein
VLATSRRTAGATTEETPMTTAKNATDLCPVCDWKLDDTALSVHAGGKTVRVCCDECRTKLLASPEKFLARA